MLLFIIYLVSLIDCIIEIFRQSIDYCSYQSSTMAIMMGILFGFYSFTILHFFLVYFTISNTKNARYSCLPWRRPSMSLSYGNLYSDHASNVDVTGWYRAAHNFHGLASDIIGWISHLFPGFRANVSIDTDIASGSAIHIIIAARYIDTAKHVSGLGLWLYVTDATLVIWFIAATNGRIPLM